jgi:hypothetical protein
VALRDRIEHVLLWQQIARNYCSDCFSGVMSSELRRKMEMAWAGET